MASVPFALYDAFSEVPFGGSQAGIVSDAAGLDQRTRQQIASEIGAPATAFITACSERSVRVRFHSPLTEYSMCGHGTVCLMTRMIEQGVLHWDKHGRKDVDLHLPSSIAPVELFRREDGRAEVLLDINPPELRLQAVDQELLAGLLGLRTQDFNQDSPIEKASGDFVHLVVPLRNLKAMNRITPDFRGLTHFCNQNGIQTIAVFCTEAEGPGSNIHMRDFCPAVGVAESAGAGTTNAALATYLVRHNLVGTADGSEQIIIQAEQGIELERPGIIRSVVSMNGGSISRLQVGGVATKIFDGELHLPVYS
jgi:trans-2,3-dihydro-3-hydroxyanthranilate isomerase